MKTWRNHPNTYDVNLVNRHDDNSVINTLCRREAQPAVAAGANDGGVGGGGIR